MRLDLQYHFVVGMVGAVALGHVGLSLGFAPLGALACASLVMASVGVLKEILWDGALGLGNVDADDALVTAAGTAVGAGIFYLMTL